MIECVAVISLMGKTNLCFNKDVGNFPEGLTNMENCNTCITMIFSQYYVSKYNYEHFMMRKCNTITSNI